MREKISTKSFIQKAKDIHKDEYDYSETVYANSKTKINVSCRKHGVFSLLPYTHIKGAQGCPKCTHEQMRLSNEDFIARSNRIYNDKYDYSKVDYSGFVKEVTIVCKQHGDFVLTAGKHLSGTGCPKCPRLQRKKSSSKTTEFFISRAKILHGDFYDYSKTIYDKSNVKLTITCKIHGDFKQAPNKHLQGRGCQDCGGSKRLSLGIFVDRARKIHKGRYGYEKAVYVNAHTKVTITCFLHGDFLQSASSHLSGRGCPDCSKAIGGVNQDNFKFFCDKNNSGIGILYVIKCYNDEEVFYKIGITSLSVERRYCNKRDMPYKYEVMYEIKGEPDKIYNKELVALRRGTEFRYKPKINFGGETECFSNLDYIENLLEIDK